MKIRILILMVILPMACRAAGETFVVADSSCPSGYHVSSRKIKSVAESSCPSGWHSIPGTITSSNDAGSYLVTCE